MKFKVVNTIYVPGLNFGEKLLNTQYTELINIFVRTEDELIRNAADADAVICSGPIQPWTARVLNALSKCRIVASLGVGYDRINLETATQYGIVVTNIPDYCIDEVSTHSIALMLALGRRLFPIDSIVREKQVNFVPPNRNSLKDFAYPVFRLRDQILGIIGFGKIGTAVALKAKGLGMKVIAYDPNVLDAVMRSHGVESADFGTLLGTSDFVSINASLTESSANRIDDDAFRKMKSSCYLINTARGEIVDQHALVRALKDGLIAGAGLDVTLDDPLSKENPLLEMPNVILTGHSAWYSVTSDSDSEFWNKAMEQVIHALKGEWPLYAVNPGVKKKWLEKWG